VCATSGRPTLVFAYEVKETYETINGKFRIDKSTDSRWEKKIRDFKFLCFYLFPKKNINLKETTALWKERVILRIINMQKIRASNPLVASLFE
jgi:3-hydroxy-3-methylglutaryl CoA synthase